MGDNWASEFGELLGSDGYDENARGVLSNFKVLFMGFKLKVKGGWAVIRIGLFIWCEVREDVAEVTNGLRVVIEGGLGLSDNVGTSYRHG